MSVAITSRPSRANACATQRKSEGGRKGPELGECRSEDSVVSLGGQLCGVHLGRRCDPQSRGQLARVLLQQLAGRAEVANVGHARAAEGLLDLGASDFRQEPGVIRVVARNNLVGRFG